MTPATTPTFAELGSNRNNSFDLIRLLLASLVLFSHCFPLALGTNETEPLSLLTGGQITLGSLAVFGFFLISGYLITASATRSSSMVSYTTKRMLRIVPGYLLVLAILLLVMVPVFQTRPAMFPIAEVLRRFVTAAITFRQFELPSVFPGVMNGSLWTIRYEIACYILVGVLAAIGLMRTVKRTRIVTSIVLIGFIVFNATGISIDGFIHDALPTPSKVVTLGQLFMIGALAYSFRDKIPARLPLAIAAGILLSLAMFANKTWWGQIGIGIGFCYLLLYLAGHQNALSRWISSRGDYSYGMYIFAFPIQQITVYLLPETSYSPWLLLLIALPITLALAICSWHIIEKPCLSFRSGVNSKPRKSISPA